MSCKWRRGQLWAMPTSSSPRRLVHCQDPWALGTLWRRLGATEPSHHCRLPSTLASVPLPPLTQPRPSGGPAACLGSPHHLWPAALEPCRALRPGSDLSLSPVCGPRRWQF